MWPISRENRPKHLLEIVGSGTMVEQTLARVEDAELFLPPLIVGAAGQGRTGESNSGNFRKTHLRRPLGGDFSLYD